jgi:hypothetical protein
MLHFLRLIFNALLPMQKLFLLFFFSLLFFGSYAQSISGKVQGSDGKPMPFVNVLLLHNKDSTLAKGAVSNEKVPYLMENIHPGTYLVAATMVGYTRAYSQPLTVKEGQGELKMALLTLAIRYQTAKGSECGDHPPVCRAGDRPHRGECS